MTNLNEMKSKELKEMAKQLGVKNWWTLKKNDLINEIAIAIGDKEDQGEEINVDEIAENAAETHEDASESIETEAHETNQEAQENEPEINVDDFTHIAARVNIKNAYNWIMGGMENTVSDGEKTMEEFAEWVNNEAFDEILTEATTTNYTEDSAGGKAPSCMKKVTKEFSARYLLSLFKADNYDIKVEIKPAQKGHAAPKRGALLAFNGKEQNICAWGKELGISPNTLYGRIYKMGWSIGKAFTTPAKSK